MPIPAQPSLACLVLCRRLWINTDFSRNTTRLCDPQINAQPRTVGGGAGSRGESSWKGLSLLNQASLLQRCRARGEAASPRRREPRRVGRCHYQRTPSGAFDLRRGERTLPMRAPNAPLTPQIRLHPEAAAVEVQALYRGIVIGARCLTGDDAAFLIGCAKGVDAPAAAALLSTDAHPLVSHDAGGFSVELTEQM